MANPMEALMALKGKMEAKKAGKPAVEGKAKAKKAPEGSPEEEKGESKEFEAGEQEGMKAAGKGKFPYKKGEK